MFDCNFLVYDTETTGIDVATVQIWEFSALAVTWKDGERSVEEHQITIRPDSPIPAEIVKLSNLTEADLAEIDAAPPFFWRAPQIAGLFGRKWDFTVGYNALKYDVPLIDNEFKRAGFDLPQYNRANVVDVLILVRAMMPNHHPKKLGSIATALGIPGVEGAHRALADCHMTAAVLERFATALPQTVEEFTAAHRRCYQRQKADFDRYGFWLRTGQDGTLEMAAGKHTGKKLSQVPKHFLFWVLKDACDEPLTPAAKEAFRSAAYR